MERQDLFDALGDAMRGTARDDLFEGRVAPGRVKSRLLEAHAVEASSDGVQHLLQALAEDAGLKVQTLGDGIWALLSVDDVFFVDALNPRFWLLHSTSTSRRLGRLLNQLLHGPQLDQAWLSSELLCALEGERRWVRSSFSSDLLQPKGSGHDVPRRSKIEVEGENPHKFLELVSRAQNYEAGAVLTAVGSFLGEPGTRAVEVAADYQGRFVASGSDFMLVAGMLWRTLDHYEAYVSKLESTHRLDTTATEEMGMTIEGEVATIELPHPVDDLDALVANLFTCREPFRLWAVPRQVRSGQWEANAVDLHVGHTLRLEVTSHWLRVLLGPKTCGNTLARLIANLQHRFDARTHLPLPTLG